MAARAVFARASTHAGNRRNRSADSSRPGHPRTSLTDLVAGCSSADAWRCDAAAGVLAALHGRTCSAMLDAYKAHDPFVTPEYPRFTRRGHYTHQIATELSRAARRACLGTVWQRATTVANRVHSELGLFGSEIYAAQALFLDDPSRGGWSCIGSRMGWIAPCICHLLVDAAVVPAFDELTFETFVRFRRRPTIHSPSAARDTLMLLRSRRVFYYPCGHAPRAVSDRAWLC